ncbi:MAG: DUF1826 domain-containing protein [Pseudomonadota bacterium]|nr:DUF1826 domain-containing protein [Pseudomonadota bacterium]
MSTAFSFSRDIDVAMPQQAFGGQADVLADIYEPQVNMAVWQRPLAGSVQRAVKQGINAGLKLNVTEEVPVSEALKTLQANYSLSQWQPALSEDVAALVDMFGCLFDTELVGLRLRTLNSAMCPKFHFDRVPCRLVMTYNGSGTQWLPNQCIAIKDGRLISDIDNHSKHINTLQEGEVALLKGSMWAGNEHTPLVHRSPQVKSSQSRLLLTLDAM